MVIPAIVIIGRELAISALREWMASLGDNDKVKVGMAGKWKTFFQLWAIGFILYEQDIGSFSPLTFGYILLYIATILTLWSMVVYLHAAWPSLTNQDPGKK
jgi:CDP-diacylglycerol--glycerol-3-phosphate 3-phosphatidyltransferase